MDAVKFFRAFSFNYIHMTKQEEQKWEQEMKFVLKMRVLMKPETVTMYPDGVQIKLILNEKYVFAHQTFHNAKQRGEMLYLRSIYIKEKFRNSQLGSRLVLKLIADAKSKGLKRIETEPISTSVAFFEKLGFQWLEGRTDRMYLNL